MVDIELVSDNFEGELAELTNFVSGVYAHGKLEDGNDQIYANTKINQLVDIVMKTGDETIGLIITPLKFSNAKLTNHPVKLFVWKTKQGNGYRLRGFVVALDDEKAIEFASERYEKRQSNL